MEFFSNFTWAVPHAFSDAVALCRFEEGDVLYDTPKAYDGPWGEAVQYINRSLQVRYPARATSTEKEKKGGVFEQNWTSEVRIELYEKQKKVGAGQIITTQGRLYTALWKGDLGVLYDDTENPPLPVNARNVTRHLKGVKKKALSYSDGQPVFAMVRDRANQVSRAKYIKVHAKLKKHLYSEPKMISPEYSGLENWDIIAPTIEIAFFIVKEITPKELGLLVKEAVYVPAKAATKDMFKLSAHGVIFK